MKKLYILLLIIISLFMFKELSNININYFPKKKDTGINYGNVEISYETTSILNPSEIKYETADKKVFENTIPRYMKTAGYWISKLKNPNKIILSQKEIAEFNKKISVIAAGITNLEKYPQTVNQKSLKKIFDDRTSWYINKKYYTENGDFVFPDFYGTISNNIDIGTKNTINIRYAITTHYSDVRIFPTKEKVLSGKTSKDIDRLQEESLDMGTPLIILCQTKDKQWSYAVAKTEEGWVETENLAFTNRKTFTEWLNMQNFVIVIEEKADIFTGTNLNFIDYVRMGTRLPYYPAEKYKNSYVIKIPSVNKKGFLEFRKAFINKKDVNIGYLQYTQRNVLNLAFKHLNEPYGWGGSNGEQDCSGYLSQIFNCFGILLPETSTQKIKCGKIVNFQKSDINEFKNISILQNAIEGISFIFFPGHIMLYIGNEDGKPYIIHAIWGLTSYDSRNNKTVNYINRVIVSDLNIGEEVAGNSLIDRVSKFNIIK